MTAEKSDKIRQIQNDLARSFFGRTLDEAHVQGICVECGKLANQFRDDLSAREYAITGMCQTCQDRFEAGEDDYDA